jgi:hypothetical protein
VQLPGAALVVRAYHIENAVVGALGGDRLGQGVAELALRSLDLDGLAVNLDLDAGRHRDRLTSDSRHY